MLFYTAYNYIQNFTRDSPHVPNCDNEIQHRPTRSTNQLIIKCSVMIRIKALRAITQPLKSIRFISTHRPNDIGFVFDIDGVLLRGKKPIPSARAALDLLNDHSIPYIFLTNGGGIPEQERINFMSSSLDLPLSPLQLVQSHTPMKALAHRHAYDRVLVVGGPGDKARECARNYGFQDVIMPMDIVKHDPSVAPHHRYTPEQLETLALSSEQLNIEKPIEAVLVFNDPRDMGTDIQVVMDLLNSENGVLGTKRRVSKLKNRESPAIPIIFSNNDFLWANDYQLPRFGQGAFRITVESLYREMNILKPSENLESIIMGKPFKIQYDFAHHVLIDWRQKLIDHDFMSQEQVLPTLGAEPSSSPFNHIYMVGDNPESDIKGANDHGWESILLRTGVYKDEDWNEIIAKPTAGVYDNVLESVQSVLRKHRII